jgi:hypothetical protein
MVSSPGTDTGPQSCNLPSTIILIALSSSWENVDNGGVEVGGSRAPFCFLLPNELLTADEGVAELKEFCRDG